MKVEFYENHIIVKKDDSDPMFSGVKNAAGESRLLYHLKNLLNSMGFDLIKKRMYKDGHLVDDMQQYLRARRPSGRPEKDVYIYNGMFAIRGCEEYFNEFGECRLSVVKDIFNK